MTKTRWYLLLILTVLGILGYLILRAYSLELVHAVVKGAVVQKAPRQFPVSRIDASFDQAFSRADSASKRKVYLMKLLDLSLRLEKIQSLEAAQVDELLKGLTENGKKQ